MFHVLDPAELEFPQRCLALQDLESGEEIPVIPDSFANEYADDAAHLEALATKFSEARIDYVLLNTSKPLDEALFTYSAPASG